MHDSSWELRPVPIRPEPHVGPPRWITVRSDHTILTVTPPSMDPSQISMDSHQPFAETGSVKPYGTAVACLNSQIALRCLAMLRS